MKKFLKKAANLAEGVVDGVVDGVKDSISQVDEQAKADDLREAIELVRASSVDGVCLCCNHILKPGDS